MAERAFLRTLPNQAMAAFFVGRLQEEGLPAIAVQPNYPYPHDAYPVEIWLLDSELLDEPGVQDRIDRVFEPPASEAMPQIDADEPTERGWLRAWHVGLALVLLVVTWGAA